MFQVIFSVCFLWQPCTPVGVTLPRADQFEIESAGCKAIEIEVLSQARARGIVVKDYKCKLEDEL